jgi:probable HAF family extracellular repeat protein
MRTLPGLAIALACFSTESMAREPRTAGPPGVPDARSVLMREPIRSRGPVVSLEGIKNEGRSRQRRYLIVDLGTLGGTQAFAYAINDKAQVVGAARTAGDLETRGFLYTAGRMSDLYPLNSGDIQTVGPGAINELGVVASGVIGGSGIYSPALMETGNGSIVEVQCPPVAPSSFGFAGVATGVNDSGVAVGYCSTDGFDRNPFVYSNGVRTDIDVFGMQGGAMAVNDDGAVTGFSTLGAFVYSKGALSLLFPGNADSYARDINKFGHIVGEVGSAAADSYRGFLYADGAVIDIGSDDSVDTAPLAINDNGQVVGTKVLTISSTCASGSCESSKQFAFIWEGGRMALLDAVIPRKLDWELSWAHDINNHGQIVGYGQRNGMNRAFLMTPAVSQQQCSKGAWKTFEFKSQGACVAFVLNG